MEVRRRELVLIGGVGGAAGLLAAYPRQATEGCPGNATSWTNLLTGGHYGWLSVWVVALVVAVCCALVSVALNRRLGEAVTSSSLFAKGTLLLGVGAAAFVGRTIAVSWYTVAGYGFVDRECWISPGNAVVGGGTEWTNSAGHIFSAKPEPLLGSIAAAFVMAILFAGLWSQVVRRVGRARAGTGSIAAA